MAHSIDVPLDLDDFERIRVKVPLIADLKPSGKYVMQNLHEVGGTPAVMKVLLQAGLLHGDCLTVTGKTVAENLADVPDMKEDQDVVRPLSDPIRKTASLVVLRGNLASDGAIR